jgi:hypothetical protein
MGREADSLHVSIDLLDVGAWALLLASLAFFASAVVFAVAWRSRRQGAVPRRSDVSAEDSADSASWHRQAHIALREARAIVDLTTPGGVDHYQPSTSVLTTVTKRIDRLEVRLLRFSTLLHATEPPTGSRLPEAVGDLRRVGASLGSALEAERSLRVGSAARLPAEREQSARRISERSAELDMAADEFSWLIETEE